MRELQHLMRFRDSPFVDLRLRTRHDEPHCGPLIPDHGLGFIDSNEAADKGNAVSSSAGHSKVQYLVWVLPTQEDLATLQYVDASGAHAKSGHIQFPQQCVCGNGPAVQAPHGNSACLLLQPSAWSGSHPPMASGP